MVGVPVEIKERQRKLFDQSATRREPRPESVAARPRRRLPWLICCALGLSLACRGRERAPGPPLALADSGPAAVSSPVARPRSALGGDAGADSALQRGEPACERRMADAEREPALPGTPQLDSKRTTLFLNVQAEPSFFLRPPDYAPNESPEVIRYRSLLERDHPGGVIARILRVFRRDRPALRDILLRQGYLYAERPELAEPLVRLARAEALFDEPQIWLQRGEQVWRAELDPKTRRYAYLDGAEAGRAVAPLLFDRMGVGVPPQGVHVDLRSLRRRLGFSRLRPRHTSERRLLADLEYGGYWVPTLLEIRGAHLEPVCELLPQGSEPEIQATRRLELDRMHAFGAVQQAILALVDDALPFDEPRQEHGQEDGKLRPAWLAAYERGQLSYSYRGERYAVFNADGQPLVPEVCVDFSLDAIERAGGTWWRPKGEPRDRTVGHIDFSVFTDWNLRRSRDVVAFARAHPEWFQVLEVPAAERVPLGRAHRLREYLLEHVADFVSGDLLLLAGPVPWDPHPVVHYHSFFVWESDPLTGMPILLAGNPSTPGIRPWKFEMDRAPKRSLQFRLRPDPTWLARAVGLDSASEAPLSGAEPGALTRGQ